MALECFFFNLCFHFFGDEDEDDNTDDTDEDVEDESEFSEAFKENGSLNGSSLGCSTKKNITGFRNKIFYTCQVTLSDKDVQSSCRFKVKVPVYLNYTVDDFVSSCA